MANYNTKEFIDTLNTKWHGSVCPLCHSGQWSVSDNVFELRQFNKGDLIIGQGPIIPIIPVTCTNCGNTIFINAIITKAIEQTEKKDIKNEQ